MEIKPSGNINILSYSLAEAPWPPEDSHCAPGTVYPFYKLDPEIPVAGFDIYGKRGGDIYRKMFYAQETSIDNQNIKRLVLRVGRKHSITPGYNQGLYIGLVTIDILNDYDKLMNPSTWQWAAYLPTLPGGTPIQYYYLNADNLPPLDPSQKWYLLVATNGSLEEIGWVLGGWGDSGLDPNWYRLWRFTYHEPGEEDGWHKYDNHYRGLVIPYTEGGGATDTPPITELTDIHTPPTGIVGVEYKLDFKQQVYNAFPCGCPATLWYALMNTDDNSIIRYPVERILECGSNYLSWNDSIVFNQPGIYHLRIVTGYTYKGNQIVDKIYDFTVNVTGVTCEDYTTQEECEAHGCYWYNNSCHSEPPTGDARGIIVEGNYYTGPYNPGALSQVVGAILIKNIGTGTGKIYYKLYIYPDSDDETLVMDRNITLNSNATRVVELEMDIPNKPGEIIPVGVKVWGDAESEPEWDTPDHTHQWEIELTDITCEDYTTQEECEAHGCYWYNNSCHSEPPPPPPPIQPSILPLVIPAVVGTINAIYIYSKRKYRGR